MLTNEISRTKYSVVNDVGFALATSFTAGAGVTQTGSYGPVNIPFSSAAGICCQYSFVNNFNVLISGPSNYLSRKLQLPLPIFYKWI